MSSLRSTTARVLLDRISKDGRAQVVQDVVKCLDATSGAADIGFAAALLELHPDDEAQRTLLSHLYAQIEQGDSSQVVSVISSRPDLAQKVLSIVIRNVSEAAIRFRDRPKPSASTRPQISSVRSTSDTFSAERASQSKSMGSEVRLLEFVSKTLNPHVSPEQLRDVVATSLFFLGHAETSIADTSRDALFAVFSLACSPTIIESKSVWSTIQHLVTSSDHLQKTVGFSVWLRWIVLDADDCHDILRQHKYWDLLVNGLKYGDTERRKACLQVLRASVDIAVQDQNLMAPIVAKNHTICSPEAVRKQYVRFCTVFETIVLGRYLNQVQECEADLDFLTSSSSLLPPIWLWTLLASALEQKMQDSNRKFIGRWTLRSNIRTDDHAAYLQFFRNALLPWATGGNLFTSTLRKNGNDLRCEHGEILSKHVSTLLNSHEDLASGVIEAILDSILSRHGNNFAYAMAYLIEGIARGFESNADLKISQTQLEGICKIPTWAGLPEVARDLIIATSWKMCNRSLLLHHENATDAIARGAQNWGKLYSKVLSLRPNSSAHVDGNIASLALERSKRDNFEESTIQKCLSLLNQLENSSTSWQSATLIEAIEDIWTDLEFLEYPKSLLAVLPSVIPHQRLVEASFQEDDSGSRLANILASKTVDLLNLAKSRSYLLSPLAISVRKAALTRPEAAELFKLDDFLVGLAESPPTPTIDAQLEDATVSLLNSLDPSLSGLNYEYYFGPREGQGFAALLDLVSRLGALQTDLHKVILNRLLGRWTRQKTPPPTVSPWKTTLQLQIMLLCNDQHMSTCSTPEAKDFVKKFYYMLAVEPLPRYRYLFEWMIARTYIHHPDLRKDIFAELRTKDHHSNPKFLASLMKLGVTIAKTETSDESFAKELANVFVPLAASSKVVIRHEAQWQVPVLMDHAKAKTWTTVSSDTAFMELDAFIRSLAHFDDPPLERRIDKLDPIRDHNLTHLVQGPWYGLDNVEQPQTSREDFLKLFALDSQDTTTHPPSCIPLGHSLPLKMEMQSKEPIDHNRKILQNIDNISRALGSGPGPAALQTKGNAYLDAARVRHENLLVIASLVDNPYNLGGLSRVSEIFGAGAMYLQNTHVTSNKDFTNVSVSSHMHLPILPLSGPMVPEFIAQKKREEGFKIVGIEQTDRSVLVGSEGCVLPEKCILVIGSEREGIPASVLTECDLLVEIPQVGTTRSLNVQTAAAIVLCEYAKQWKKG